MAQYNYEPDRWKNRVSTDPTKRKLTIVSDSSSTLSENTILTATVERDDTIQSGGQAGTPFNAENMNDLETRINSSFQKCLEYIDFGSINNTDINSNDGFNFNETTSNLITQCPILEFFYTNSGNSDGIASSRIFIYNYNQENRISLDQITCNADPENNFHLKSLTLIIQAYNGVVNIKKSDNNSKTLHYTPTNSWNADKNLDIVIHKIIGYRFSTQNQ